MKKTILLTGATDGIGFETAKILATSGHTLLLHGRNQQKLEELKATLLGINSEVDIELYRADFSILSEVKAMAEEIAKQHHAIHGIINNAGVFVVDQKEVVTQDGVDVRFAVNTIAPYILTKRLLGSMAENGRIVNVSSAAQAPVSVNELRNKKMFSHDEAYAKSKLAIIMWSMELANSDFVNEKNIVVVSVNPKSFLGSKMVKVAYGKTGYDLKIGANILIEAMTSNAFENANGLYYDNDACRFANPHTYALDEKNRREILEYLDSF